jgi:hypothetical protein
VWLNQCEVCLRGSIPIPSAASERDGLASPVAIALFHEDLINSIVPTLR